MIKENFFEQVDELFNRLTQNNFLGFDEVFNTLRKAAPNPTTANVGYPPYNLLCYLDGSYVLEIALAGFSPSDISITLDNNILSIATNFGDDEAASDEKKDDSGISPPPKGEGYIHKGIARRSFQKKFHVNDLEVSYADMQDGLLRISLRKNKSVGKKIPINAKVTGPEYLTETNSGKACRSDGTGWYNDDPNGPKKRSWGDESETR